MKKYYLWVHILTGCFLCLIIFYQISTEWAEWFPGAGKIFDIANRFAEAFLASCIIFYLIEYFPFISKKKQLKKSQEIIMYQINDDMSNLLANIFSKFSHTFSDDTDPNSIPSNNTFDKKKKVILKYTFGGSFAMMPGKGLLPFQMSVKSIKYNIDRLLYDYKYLDSELEYFLSGFFQSNFFEFIEKCQNDEQFFQFVDKNLNAINKLSELYLAFNSHLRKKKWPLTASELKNI